MSDSENGQSSRRAVRIPLRIVLALVAVVVIVVGGVRMAGRDERAAASFKSADGALISPDRLSEAVGLSLSAIALRDKLETTLGSREMSALPSCIDVRTEWGAPIVARNAEESMSIASNTKLFLTGAALSKFGADHRMKTFVVGKVDSKGRAQGGLWLVGGGDPFLSTLEFKAWEEAQDVQRPTTSLAALADSVVAAGMKSAPQVIGDSMVFDDQKTVATHSKELLAQKLIPPISGLSVNRNIKNWATGPKQDPTFVENPAAAAAGELTRLLRDRGVSIDGAPTSGPAPEGATEIASVESADLAGVVAEINEESDNFAAEMLTKYLGTAGGGQGTTPAGVDVMNAQLDALGIPGTERSLKDGSGLSRNSASCRRISDLLVAMAATSAGDAFASSLAVAGSSGTLKKRFVDTPVAGKVRAKTGSLNDVSALSGYVDDGRGYQIVFAYVINVPRADRVRLDAEDAVCRGLLGYPEVEGPPPLGQSG